MLRTPRSDIARVIDEVGLTDAAHTLVDELSGGQRGRASLAVALLGTPRLLVLDEPTVGVDPALREELWNLFRSLRQRGVSLLVSSHVMDEASRCDQLLLMHNGHIKPGAVQTLEWISYAMPLSYAVDAINEATSKGELTTDLATNTAVVLAFAVLALLLGAATLQRRTP